MRCRAKWITKVLFCIMFMAYGVFSNPYMVTQADTTRNDQIPSANQEDNDNQVIIGFKDFDMEGLEPFDVVTFDGNDKSEPELPEHIWVLYEGQEDYIQVDANWTCMEDFWGTDQDYYSYRLDLTTYNIAEAIADQAENLEIQLPWIIAINEYQISPMNVVGSAASNEARRWIGVTPYKWGGNSLTSGADCTGFVIQVYKNVGVDLSANRTDPGNSSKGYSIGTSLSNAEPGDIITWKYSGGGHVAIYSGMSGGRHKMIHCLNTRYNTVETDATAVWVSNGAYIQKITRMHEVSTGSRIYIPDGNYMIRSISGKVLEIGEASMENGATVNIWDDAGWMHQRFHVENKGNNYISITPLHNFKSIEVRNSSFDNGAAIAQWDFADGYDCKIWYVIDLGDGYVTIVNKNSGKALDIYNGTFENGNIVHQWDINYSDAQKFQFIRIQ